MKRMFVDVTRHAEKRMRERVGIPKNAVQRFAQLVLDYGYRHDQTKGKLNKYLDKIYLQQRTANNMRVYGDKVYLFNANRLITVLQIPQDMARHIMRYIKED